jgi:membrane protein YqaA with SNARE-associated domain
MVVAALWGFAESTLFFIVPDVWLTFVAMFSASLAFRACGAVTLGALVGGTVMRRWGRGNPQAARHAIGVVPGISPRMIERVERDLRQQGLRAMLLGPLRGVPYKIYAVAAGGLRYDRLQFVLFSVPARVPRLILLTAAACGLNGLARGHLSTGARCAILGVIWGVFYVWYFRAMRRGERRREVSLR